MSMLLRSIQYLTPTKSRLAEKRQFSKYTSFDITVRSWNSNSSLVRETSEIPSARRKEECFKCCRLSYLSRPAKKFIPRNNTDYFSSLQRKYYSSQNDDENTKLVKDRLASEDYHVAATHWMTQLKSIPNIITLARMGSAPILAHWIISGQNDLALIGCFVACVSDVVDGFIARKYNMTTTLGTYLDPLSDKVLVNVLAVSLWWNETLPAQLVVLWVGRDLLLMSGTYFVVKDSTVAGSIVMDPVTTPLKVNPTTLSKLNTGFQFVTLLIGIGSEQISTIFPNVDVALNCCCWLTGFTTIGSGLSYLGHSAFSVSDNIVNKRITGLSVSMKATKLKNSREEHNHSATK